MQLKIIDRLSHDRGVIYKIKISDKNKEILYLSHAIERIKKTVYFPYQDRYFKGGGVYEDKIFKGS